MSYAVGFDERWKRDVGYGVPSLCDRPGCLEKIDRGLAYVCGGEQLYGGDKGCGLYFCDTHRIWHRFRTGENGLYCERCCAGRRPFAPKPDLREWLEHKMNDPSWEAWRRRNPDKVRWTREVLAMIDRRS